MKSIFQRQNISRVGKYIVSDALSWLTNNSYKQTTHNPDYLIETMSELFDIDELPEYMLPISLIS